MLVHFISLLSFDSALFLGIMSGLLSVIAFIPYLRDTLAGRTFPCRATWLIWAVLGSISFASQVAEGAGASLWFAAVQVGSTILVFIISIRMGAGEYLSRRNICLFVVAGCGLVLWFVTDTSAYALIIAISISLLGGTATIVKAYQDPASETLCTWAISLGASVCAVASVGQLDWVLLAYPLYLLTLYTGIVGAILLGRANGRLAVADRSLA